MARRYDPNDRVPDGIQKARIQQDRVAWVRCDWLDVIQSRMHTVDTYDDDVDVTEEDKQVEYGNEVRLKLFTRNGKGMMLPLTHFTASELDAMKEIIDRAFSEARGESHRRDVAAQEAAENGHDTFARLYRPVPQVMYRKGEKRQHDEGVRSGSSGDAGVE